MRNNNSYYLKQRIIRAQKIAFSIICICWVVGLIQFLGLNLTNYGVLPRSKDGLIGIVFSPFIHGDFKHLLSNTIPFFLLSFLLFLFYRNSAFFILFAIWVTTGILTWIIGRSAWHIGASGIIYGLAFFLVFAGFLSRDWKLILVSILVFVLYSSLIWAIFPTERNISWEGHLSGAISGILWAWLYRKTIRKENKL